MILPEFELLIPETIENALEAAEKAPRAARFVAGGTDVFPDLKREYDRRLRFPSHPPFRPGPFPSVLISLRAIESLKGVSAGADGSIRAGAAATMRELAESKLLRGHAAALADAAASVGSPQVRNLATIGGNLCNARPCADTAPAGMVLGMSIEARRGSGKRGIDSSGFFKGPGATLLEPGEIVESVTIPAARGRSASAFFKLGTRKAFEISIVSAAAMIETSGESINAAKICIGSCGPVPILAGKAAAFLAGKKPEKKILEEAARIAASETSPIDDFRATAGYRISAARTLVFRALSKAAQRAGVQRG